MRVDAHLHCTGRETAADVLRTLDEADTDVGVLLEAMACGVPAVASRVGGVPDPEARRTMGALARERALRHFSLAHSAERIGRLFTRLARPAPPEPAVIALRNAQPTTARTPS